jgi:hypothetical protein
MSQVHEFQLVASRSRLPRFGGCVCSAKDMRRQNYPREMTKKIGVSPTYLCRRWSGTSFRRCPRGVPTQPAWRASLSIRLCAARNADPFCISGHLGDSAPLPRGAPRGCWSAFRRRNHRLGRTLVVCCCAGACAVTVMPAGWRNSSWQETLSKGRR